MAEPTTRRYREAIDAFDASNAEDPRHQEVGGESVPKELLYARRMTRRLRDYAPDAPEVVWLAARCQHICRWRIPRGDYPMDRSGYKRWRTDLSKMHAEMAGQILRQVGYDDATADRVGDLLRKKKLKADPDVQLLEDVVDLVFVEHYLADFAADHPEYDDDKFVDIIRKTLIKMSADGRRAALAIDLPDGVAELVGRAVDELGE